jgi:diguanylate cyclase (GGDEF)-like protein
LSYSDVDIDDLKEQAEHLAVIHNFAQKLPELDIINELLWYVVEEVIPKLGFEDCVIYLIDEQSQMLHQSARWNINVENKSRKPSDFSLALGEGITGSCAKTGTIINIADTTKDERYKENSGNFLSECAIPLRYNNKIIGILDSEHSQAGYFTKEKENLLVTVVSLLSASVGKTISLDRVEQTIEQLRNAEKLQKALYEISSLFHKAHNMDDFYTHLHKVVGTLMYTGNFGIVLYDKSNERINVPYFVDTIDEAPDSSIDAALLKKTLTYYCITQNKSLLLSKEDIIKLDIKHKFERYGTTPNAWMGAPFIVDKNTTGIIVVQSYLEPIVYDNKDIELLKFVAQHLNTTLKYMLAQEQIQHQALHDPLTGLPNRSLFNDRLKHRMAGRKRNSAGMFAILFLDLDHFKIINDTLGHHVGDSVLQKVSHHLTESVRVNDTVARFGGDEFAILLESIEAQSEAIDAAERIIKAIEQEMMIAGAPQNISVSIGIRCCTDENDIAELIQNADLAMYQAKHSGRGCYSIYLKDQIIIEKTRKKINSELKIAITKKQFILHYQPIILLEKLTIVGFEALVRWQHPNGGLLAPADFIDIAEETGLITDIDILVMDMTLSQIKTWNSANPDMRHISINVNLSALHFTSNNIVTIISELLEKYQISGKQLKIELTETALIESIEIMADLINQIRALDVVVLLDDFGTGYSSLSYLHQFHIDILKIDRSFIRYMQNDSEPNPIITTIAALAEAMSMKIVAEGIEEHYQLEKLAEMGCQYGQGFLFAKPLPEEEAFKLFSEGISL